MMYIRVIVSHLISIQGREPNLGDFVYKQNIVLKSWLALGQLQIYFFQTWYDDRHH